MESSGSKVPSVTQGLQLRFRVRGSRCTTTVSEEMCVSCCRLQCRKSALRSAWGIAKDGAEARSRDARGAARGTGARSERSDAQGSVDSGSAAARPWAVLRWWESAATRSRTYWWARQI